MSSCCCVSNEPTLQEALLDPCCCNTIIGGTVVINGQLYRRQTVSYPCDPSDFILWVPGGGMGILSFFIEDDAANQQTILDTNIITTAGNTGVNDVVSPVRTLTLDGLTFEALVDPVLPPAVTTQVNIWVNVDPGLLQPKIWLWSPVLAMWVQTGLLLTSNSLPVADFFVSQRGMTAILDGSASTSTQQLVTLSHSWTSSPAVGVVFSTPLLATTNVSFTTPGSYTITLTVTDSNGAVATKSRVLRVDRILNVKGTNQHEQTFETLLSALTYIDVNDPANASRYRIFINGITSDAVLINPAGDGNPMIHFNVGGRVTRGIQLAPLTPKPFYFSADNWDDIHIDVSTEIGLEFITGQARWYMDGLKIRTNNATFRAINGNINILEERFNNCTVVAPLGSAFNSSWVGVSANIRDTVFWYCRAESGNGNAYDINNQIRLRFLFNRGIGTEKFIDINQNTTPITTPVLLFGNYGEGSGNGVAAASVFYGISEFSDTFCYCLNHTSIVPIVLGAVAADEIAAYAINNIPATQRFYLWNSYGDGSNATGLIRTSSANVASNFLVQNVLRGTRGSLSSVITQPGLTTPWNPARVVNNILGGNPSSTGLVTFIAVTALGAENVQF